jgi:hypothetical protein
MTIAGWSRCYASADYELLESLVIFPFVFHLICYFIQMYVIKKKVRQFCKAYNEKRTALLTLGLYSELSTLKSGHCFCLCVSK